MDFQLPALGALFSTAGAAFVVIFLAEFGDKSQLVCMSLAARHRPWPVLLGAVGAFALLNLLAVLFGAVVAAWIPQAWLALAVALLFGIFGVQALLFDDGEEEADAGSERSGHSLFITSFLLIFVAEFGDKTQLAVAGLGSTQNALAVWLGSTLALLGTTVLGVVAGRRFINHLPLGTIHRISGLLFLGLAAFALYQAFA
ncbi:TMEM165/GDT1 family protein [Motiliproteus sp. SC1-56]|uniref:TMEM165/GDT1 family protein n=1 Tax=Motiliproteus sp. SC1-56 TaxID=2799565 RepID=UPI001A8CE69E|nr:TMEM165/GDT1 family protein [Motiliproteus sp. SC1-56]